MTLTIRRATLADAELVTEFNRLLAEESEGKQLDLALLVPGVRAALADPHKTLYFLALEGEAIVGQISVTYEWSDWRNGWFWWIQSVYVRPESRRRGVFRTLYQHVERAAQTDPEVIGIRLYVDDANRAAHGTYQNMGMERTSYHVLEKYPL